MSTDKGNPIGIPNRVIDGEELGLGAQALILNYLQGNCEALLASGSWNWQTELNKTLLVGNPTQYQPVITKIVLIAQSTGIVSAANGGDLSFYDNDSLENLTGNWFGIGNVPIINLGNQTGKFDVEGGCCALFPPSIDTSVNSYYNAWTVLTGDLIGQVSTANLGPAPVYYMVFGIRSPPII